MGPVLFLDYSMWLETPNEQDKWVRVYGTRCGKQPHARGRGIKLAGNVNTVCE